VLVGGRRGLQYLEFGSWEQTSRIGALSPQMCDNPNVIDFVIWYDLLDPFIQLSSHPRHGLSFFKV